MPIYLHITYDYFPATLVELSCSDRDMTHWWLKNLPAMQETWVRSLVGEDPLEKEMAPHSSILAWKIPWGDEPGGL